MEQREHRISAGDVKGRAYNFPRDNYLYIGSIMKGVALYFATLVLMEIFKGGEWRRLPPWLASLAIIFVTHLTWGRGVLLTGVRANVRDSVFPLLMGISEFFMFDILQSDKVHPEFWLNWFLTLVANCFLAVMLVRNRISQTKEEDFEGNMQLLVKDFRGWLKTDWLGAGGIGVFALLSWLAGRLWISPYYGAPRWAQVQAVLAAATFLMLCCKVIPEANEQRAKIANYVTNLPDNESIVTVSRPGKTE